MPLSPCSCRQLESKFKGGISAAPRRVKQEITRIADPRCTGPPPQVAFPCSKKMHCSIRQHDSDVKGAMGGSPPVHGYAAARGVPVPKRGSLRNLRISIIYLIILKILSFNNCACTAQRDVSPASAVVREIVTCAPAHNRIGVRPNGFQPASPLSPRPLITGIGSQKSEPNFLYLCDRASFA